MREAEDRDVISKVIEILNKIYTKVAFNLEFTKAGEIMNDFIFHMNKNIVLIEYSKAGEHQRSRKIKHLIELGESVMKESEKRGMEGISPHQSIFESEMIVIDVDNNANLKCNRKFSVEILNLSTLWELRQIIGSYLKASGNTVRILFIGDELKENENGTCLKDLKMVNHSRIVVTKKMEEIDRVHLMGTNGEITPLAKKVFTSWYEDYSIDGQMDSNQCALFVRSCTSKSQILISIIYTFFR